MNFKKRISSLNGVANNLKEEARRKVAETATDFAVAGAKHFGGTGENMLFSPVSALMTLAIAEDAAKGETKKQLSSIIKKKTEEIMFVFDRGFKESELSSEGAGKVRFANGIFLIDNENVLVNEQFLKKYERSWLSEVRRIAVGKAGAHGINEWAKKKCRGIGEVIKDVSEDTGIILLNTLRFEGKWESRPEFSKWGTPFRFGGKEVWVSALKNREYAFLSGENAVGFKKPYVDGKYSFAVILPDEDISLNDYISKLTGEKLYSMLKEKDEEVEVVLPKFRTEAELDLKSFTKELGANDAFDEALADFSNLAISKDPDKKMRIGDFRQKAKIKLDEEGTVASAETSMCWDMLLSCEGGECREVYLDRPFLYMIVDNEYNLPLFIGTVENDEALEVIPGRDDL